METGEPEGNKTRPQEEHVKFSQCNPSSATITNDRCLDVLIFWLFRDYTSVLRRWASDRKRTSLLHIYSKQTDYRASKKHAIWVCVFWALEGILNTSVSKLQIKSCKSCRLFGFRSRNLCLLDNSNYLFISLRQAESLHGGCLWKQSLCAFYSPSNPCWQISNSNSYHSEHTGGTWNSPLWINAVQYSIM